MGINLDTQTIIRVTEPVSGESLLVACNLSDASSPVLVNYLTDSGWSSTQYQCADTRHDRGGLARLGKELLRQALELDDDTELEWGEVEILADDADTTHETAEEWYDSYGWHLTTEDAGDVLLQAVEYDWLDDSDDDTVIDRLLASDDQLSRDEAESLVSQARTVRDAAESICGLLDEAVSAYERRDRTELLRLLDEAKSAEQEHGDSPASKSLRSEMLTELADEVRNAVFAD